MNKAFIEKSTVIEELRLLYDEIRITPIGCISRIGLVNEFIYRIEYLSDMTVIPEPCGDLVSFDTLLSFLDAYKKCIVADPDRNLNTIFYEICANVVRMQRGITYTTSC